jgi:hypothetical protein
MSSRMNEFMLKQLLSENARLQQEVQLSKDAMKVSEACKSLIEYLDNTEEPFDMRHTGENPYKGSPSNGDCCSVM